MYTTKRQVKQYTYTVKKRSFLMRIGIDVLGILAIIAAGIIGPLIPGPGGIPLLIIGLSLLANNHEWAERWLSVIKRQGVNISDKIFSDNPRTKIFLDIVSVLFIAIAVLVVTQATRSIFKTAALSFVIAALLLFFGNRGRWKNFKKKIR
jgi:hypothetical protein